MIAGVLAALIAQTPGIPDAVAVGVGIVIALVVAAALGVLAYRTITSTRRAHHPRFPR